MWLVLTQLNGEKVDVNLDTVEIIRAPNTSDAVQKGAMLARMSGHESQVRETREQIAAMRQQASA